MTTPNEPTRRMTRFRWVILGLVFFATTVNYLDRMVMGILAPDLQKLYSITDQQYGNIQSAFALSYAQRTLSRPARLLRRQVERVSGSITLVDGTIRPLDSSTLRAPLEQALRAMSWGLIAFAAAFAVARLF